MTITAIVAARAAMKRASMSRAARSGTAAATILAKAVLMAGSWRLATISRESTRRSAPRFPSALPGEEWMDGS